MKNPFKALLLAVLAAMLVLTGCGGGGNDPAKTLSYKDAAEQVRAYVDSGKVQYSTVEHGEDTSWVGVDTTAEDLPPIDKYPLSVEGKGDIVVTIASSTEKANVKQERWLDQMARKFNASGATVNGKRVAISIRPIASGLALDYITSGKHIPDAYSPSNELWTPMIQSSGVKVQQVEKRLAGNTAGILLKQDVYDTFTKKYGAVTVPNVVKAVMAGDLVLAHTDPNQSSTGLNILTQELLALDGTNPLSPKAVEAYRQFQAKVPPTSPTTDEMSKVAAKGLANAMIMEAQAFAAQPALATGWKFTPVGVRHDSPLYALDGPSKDKLEALNLFSKFSISAEGQESASQFGFNQYNDYKGADSKLSAAQLFGALDVWKNNKDAGVPVVSMFVVDRSGSMDENSKMDQAKKALRAASSYISPNNYVGLVSYSSDVTLDLPIGKFDDKQHSRFVGAVNDLRPNGGTATNSAIIAALHQMLQFQAAGQNVKFRIILLSDGMQSGGLELKQALEVVGGLKVPVYGISFETGSELSSMQALAGVSESAYVITADGQDAASKLRAMARAEL